VGFLALVVPPEPGEAGRGAQLKRLRALTSGDVDGSEQVCFGFTGGRKEQVGADAIAFRLGKTLLPLLDPRVHLLEKPEPTVNVP